MPLDNLIKQKCGIKTYVRYSDDMVLISNNKRQLHKTLPLIQSKLKELGLEMKSDYQIFAIQKHKKYTKGKIRGRKIDFLGKCYGRGFTTIRKRRSLALIRQSNTIARLQKNHQPITYKMAASFISRCSCLLHCNS